MKFVHIDIEVIASWFICSSWWWVDTEDDKPETLGHMSVTLKVSCNASTNFVAEPFCFNITDVDPDIAWKRVGEHSTHLFRWHWHRDEESIVSIVIWIIYLSILPIVNATMAGLPDASRKFQLQWGSLEPNGDGDLYAHYVTPSFDNKTTARCAKAVMQL